MKKTFIRFKNYNKIYKLPHPFLLFPPFIYKKIVRLLKGNILDIGGANGIKLINLLKNSDYSKIKSIDIIEPSPLYEEATHNVKKYKKVTVYNKELKNMIKMKKKYDIILFLEIIEHLDSPESAIKDIKKLLKPNGVLILSTPNKFVYYFFCRLKKEPIDPTHISEMTYKELKKLMTKYFNKNYFFGFFPLMFIIRAFPKLDIINKVYKNFRFLSRTIYCFSSDNLNFKL